MDNNSLSHTKWNCKYRIVFAPKYRRKISFLSLVLKYFTKIIELQPRHMSYYII